MKKSINILLLLSLVLLSISEELPSKYDSRDLGLITKVKDQGDTNICWAFASISSSEASILKNKDKIDSKLTSNTLDLNPYALAYRRHFRTADPLGNVDTEKTNQNYLQQSGDPSYSATVLSLWNGPIPSSKNYDADPFEFSAYHLENAIYIDPKNLSLDERISQLKKAILDYGAITFSYNNRFSNKQYYNPHKVNGDYYGHACTLIGWEDDISGSQFYPTATKNGGWIVKNSYQSLSYFYMSFESTTSSHSWAFDYAPLNKYDYNYFYDGNNDDVSLVQVDYGANIYLAKKGNDEMDEYIKAINVGIQGNNYKVEIMIYTDVQNNDPESGTKEATIEKSFEYGGYRTIELEDPILIEKGTQFAIIVKVTNAYIRTCMSLAKGKSRRKTSSGWTVIGYSGFSLRIKAYTKLEKKGSITPSVIPISNAKIGSSLSTYSYTGNEIKPEIQLTYKDTSLELNTDYTISYQDNINAGTGKIIIKGIGLYKGSREEIFTITSKDINQCSIVYNSQEFVYDGKEKLIGVVITCGEKTLNKDTDYKLKYENNILPSANAKIIVSGTNNYGGSTFKLYSINQASISSCNIEISTKTYTYDGLTKTPDISVVCNNSYPQKDKDFTVSFSDNIAPGLAKVKVTGKGNYKGEKEENFTIVKGKLPTISEKVYPTKGAKKLKDIQLPNDWEWENPELELNSSLSNARVIYTGSDKNYYENTSTSLSIVVKSSTEESSALYSQNIRISSILVTLIMVILI